MNSTSQESTFTRRLKSEQTLPVLPYIAHDILVSTSSNDIDVSEVANSLAREPGLAARIIAVANYAFFSRRETIYSLESAIMRIGMNRIRVLATSLLLNEVFDTSSCPAFHLEKYWYDSIATAFASARLAPHTAPQYSPDAAYLGGVLHSIGLALLVHTFPAAINQILAEHNQDPDMPLSNLIFQSLGSDYGEAGGMLLREWGLPEPIVAVAGHAHQSSYKGPYAELVETVRFTHEWLQSNYDANRITTHLDIDARVLQRVAQACAAEEDALTAFAGLLAHGEG